MSLHPLPVGPIPEETTRVARAAFPKGNVFMQMRDVLGAIYDDAQFTELFAVRGRPAEAPWRLALVSVMQFAEGLSDRQAAEAVRARIDWKYTLGLELTDPGFDFSVLSEFRARLVQGAAEHLLLDALLEACTARGYLKARGRQRTDSTHVLGALRLLSRLERVAETLRAALNALAVVAPDWLRSQVTPDWFERYGRRIEEYRLPRGQAARLAYATQVGTDGQRLLEAVAAEDAPEPVRALPQLAVLRQVWDQQYLREGGQVRLRDPKALPASAELIDSPYDAEARYATKGETHWVGYKVHLTETCEEPLPHLITQVETTVATVPDVVQFPHIQEALANRHLLPDEHLVDAGYPSAQNLVSSHKHQVDLVGPAYLDRGWQAKARAGFDVAAFQLDWERQVATCPRGRQSIRWCETHTARQRTMIHVDFAASDCLVCPVRSACTRAQTIPRSLTLQPRAEHEAMQYARARQQTPAFKLQYARRAGIEGTFSQGVQSCGLRSSRYRGKAKTIPTEYPTHAGSTRQ
jgi:transposase